ncbi:MAG: GlsB/YeaQ/YmgE family stress response membrane protein [Bryobacterales bacterium]|nr:GlsB/YeaQ/YmgE family stress response membrane protein [Bryobacterales bacterium]
MEILSWIFFGLIVGVIAKLLVPGRDPGGIIVTILLGIVGSILGGWVGRVMGWYAPGEPAGWIMSILGAIVVLLLFKAIRRPRVVA